MTKAEILEVLRTFQSDLKALRRDISGSTAERVSTKALRERADELATRWVEDIRSPLEYKFALPAELIAEFSESMKRLHVLSRPNNRRTSYLEVLGVALKNFEDRFLLPIQQASFAETGKFSLETLIPGLTDQAETEYMSEAIEAANAGLNRAAIVLGWCATIDRIQRKILALGLTSFNAASKSIKAQTTGKFKRWNKEFSVTTLSDLQTVFDTDLVVVLEGMQLIDGNQADRLEVCFQYRNHSAHPGHAPIGQPHLVAFFTDIAEIVLANPKFVI